MNSLFSIAKESKEGFFAFPNSERSQSFAMSQYYVNKEETEKRTLKQINVDMLPLIKWEN